MKTRRLWFAAGLVWACAWGFAAAAGQPAGVKWHPGHYVFVGGGAIGPQSILDHFRGVQKCYSWRALEPEPGRYDFSGIKADLELLRRHGKQLVLQMQYKAFGKGRTMVPAYLKGPQYGGGVYRASSGSFDPVLWNAKVGGRMDALFAALGRELDADPTLEAVVLPETAPSANLARSPQEGVQTYTEEIYLEALKQRMKAMREAFAHTVVIQYANFPQGSLPQLTDYMKELGVGLGGPDVYPRPNAVNDPKKGVYRLYPKMSGTVPLGAAVQSPDYSLALKKRTAAFDRGEDRNAVTVDPAEEVPFPPREHLKLAQEQLKLNYLFWSSNPKECFENVKKLLAEPDLAGDPAGGLDSRCPTKAFVEAPTLVKSAHSQEASAMPAAADQSGQRRPRSQVQEVVVVFKTHFDIGYTDLATSVVQRYRTSMIDAALGVVDQNENLPERQKFVWTIPGWPMHKILDWPEQDAERARRVRQALERGRFVIHALPFTMHTELLEAEDLTRGLGYSSRICRQLGLPLPTDAKMTDVPEHTWFLPTLLSRAGVRFMHIGCNGMSSPLGVPPLYWWEGPDGSRVLTMYSARYGTELAPPADWPYRTWLALIHTGDNHGPPRPEEVKKLLDQAAAQLPGVKVRIGRLSDFADAILAEKPDLPVVRGDSPDTWIHGPMSDPAGMKIARAVRPMLSAAAALNTELRAWGVGVPDATAALAAAHEQSLLYGEHTWGGSVGWIKNMLSFGEQFTADRAAGRFTRIEASWAEHSAYIAKAHELTVPVYMKNMTALADAVDVPGERLVVFNPLPWPRDGYINLGPKGFVARDVPPLGYRAYKLNELPAASSAGFQPASREGRQDACATPLLRHDAEAGTMENDAFKIALDPVRGAIKSLIDKRTGRELVDPTASQGFGQYLYERFDQNQVFGYCDAYNRPGRQRHQDFDKPGLPPASTAPYKAASPKRFTVRIERTASAVCAIMDAPAGDGLPAVSTRVTLDAGLPYVNLEITLRDKPIDPWPEAGWLCLPFKVDNPQYRLGRLGSIVDPARDLIPASNRDIFALNTALTLTGPGGGVAVCPLDHPLVSLGRPGCWRYSKEFAPEKPCVYVNLFNNQWDTNFRLWTGGTWSSRVRIWSVEGAGADFVSPALEARYPLQVAKSDKPAGKLPAEQAGLRLSRKGVLVGAFGPNPDGKGMLLRVWEQAGRGGTLRVDLPRGMRAERAQSCDLRGVAQGAPIPIREGAFEFELKAFAPGEVILE